MNTLQLNAAVETARTSARTAMERDLVEQAVEKIWQSDWTYPLIEEIQSAN